MKFSIGEFSRITSLSIKSLRFYHEKGILIPSEVNEFTGYRHYDEANYERAKSIKILRDYDFSLSEIKDILEECSDETDMLEHLQKKMMDIQHAINRYKEISRSIETIIQQERESAMKTNEHFQIEEKKLPTILIAGHRMKGKYSDVGKGFGIIGKKMGRYINGKAMALYYDGEYKEEDANYEACFPVRKGESTDTISVRELKGGEAVTLIHKGSYDKLSQSYKKVYTYLNEKGMKTSLPTREVYLKGPGMILKGNPNNYLTEIQILIKK